MGLRIRELLSIYLGVIPNLSGVNTYGREYDLALHVLLVVGSIKHRDVRPERVGYPCEFLVFKVPTNRFDGIDEVSIYLTGRLKRWAVFRGKTHSPEVDEYDLAVLSELCGEFVEEE